VSGCGDLRWRAKCGASEERFTDVEKDLQMLRKVRRR